MGQSNRVDEAARVLHAPANDVYAALVRASARCAWLPPTGMSGRFERFDARVGGGYRMVLTYDAPDSISAKSADNADVVEARFVEMVPGVRVVEAIDFVSADPAFAGTMTMTWTLTSVREGTEVRVTAANVPSGISAADHASGMQSSLANLAAYVE
jgi:uncharacterized protein YndB with AHSA1/START domain